MHCCFSLRQLAQTCAVITVLLFVLAGCAGMPEPIESVRCFDMLGDAAMYVTLDAQSNRAFAESFASFGGAAGDLSPIFDRTGRVCLAFGVATETMGNTALLAVLQGSYPIRIVRSQLKKNGWQEQSCTNGVYYSLESAYVAVSSGGLLLFVSNGDDACVEAFLARVKQVETGGSVNPIVLPQNLDTALDGDCVLVWCAQPSFLFNRLAGDIPLMLPLDAVSAVFMPVEAQHDSATVQKGVYSALFTAYPRSSRMVRATSVFVDLFAKSVLKDSPDAVVTVLDSAVQLKVEHLDALAMIKNFRGE